MTSESVIFLREMKMLYMIKCKAVYNPELINIVSAEIPVGWGSQGNLLREDDTRGE